MRKLLLLITLLLFSSQVFGRAADFGKSIHISITTPKKETKYDVCFAKKDGTILVTEKIEYERFEKQDSMVEFFKYRKPKKKNFYLGLKKRGSQKYNWCLSPLDRKKIPVPSNTTHILIDDQKHKDITVVEFRYHSPKGDINTIGKGFVKK